jgi:hypothetical protein
MDRPQLLSRALQLAYFTVAWKVVERVGEAMDSRVVLADSADT